MAQSTKSRVLKYKGKCANPHLRPDILSNFFRSSIRFFVHMQPGTRTRSRSLPRSQHIAGGPPYLWVPCPRSQPTADQNMQENKFPESWSLSDTV